MNPLTFLCALFETVVDLLKHGLAASLKDRQHNALEGVFVGRLNGPLHGFGCCPTDGVGGVLERASLSDERGRGSAGNGRTEVGLGPLTLDLTTLVTLSFRAASTAVSLAATVLLR